MLRWTFLLLSLVLCSLPAGNACCAEVVNPLYTNKARFRIPYRFDAGELARAGAAEIQLYVSTDLGRNWTLTQKVGLQQGKFEYTAPQEGEYWFAVRTIDALGQLNPPGKIIDPGLIVIVDATAPTMKLELSSSQPQRVEIAWGVADANLLLDSLIIEYREDDAQDWKRVQLIPTANGKTSWTTTAQKTEVRGKIFDRAENANTTNRDLVIMQQSAMPTAIPAPLRTRTNQPSGKTSDFGNNNQEQPYVPDFSQPIAQESIPELTQNSSLDETGKLSMNSPDQQMNDLELPNVKPPQNIAAEKPAVEKYSRIEYPEVLPGISSAQIMDADLDQQLYDPYTPVSQKQSQLQKTRVVNVSQFQVDYMIDDVGPSGISSVDIYITENQGQRWWKYGQDRDMKSPAMIEVPHDGEFGFSIRVKNGIGSSPPPPQVGEVPQLTVKIDRTPPTVKKMQVRQGEGQKLNRLYFDWVVEDEHLAEKPVSLYSAKTPEGPWEPIIGWQADKGGFEWVMGKEIPPQLFFRLAVRDSAGNVATSTTPTPIAMDLSRPTARILDVAPLR